MCNTRVSKVSLLPRACSIWLIPICPMPLLLKSAARHLQHQAFDAWQGHELYTRTANKGQPAASCQVLRTRFAHDGLALISIDG